MTEVSERIIQGAERFAEVIEKTSAAMDKIPRIVGMFGTAYFAGKASERVGGSFEMGALAGAVAHDLAHSQLPNNQLGGIALAAYLSTIGLLNILPQGPPTVFEQDPDEVVTGAGGTALDPENVYSGLEPTESIMNIQDCHAAGGTVVRVIPQSALVVCSIIPPDPAVPIPGEIFIPPVPRPIRPGRITR